MKSLPAPETWKMPLPEAMPPPGMALYQLPTGSIQTPGAVAIRGGSLRDTRHFAATPVLVRHPRGDVLIDAGFGQDVAGHMAVLRRMQRSPYEATTTAGQQLAASGYDRSRLLGVLLTHSHWDHVSGLDDLAVPIWTNAAELEYAAGSGVDGRVFQTVSEGHSIHEYEFTGPPYLGFPSSFDLHGDGSVVLTLAGGHTTGSVVVFVALPTSRRYAFIGDLTWQLDGIERRLPRPWLMSRLADSDPAQVKRSLLRMISLAGLIRVVPAHAAGAFDQIPRLPDRWDPPGAQPDRRTNPDS